MVQPALSLLYATHSAIMLRTRSHALQVARRAAQGGAGAAAEVQWEWCREWYADTALSGVCKVMQGHEQSLQLQGV